MLVVFIYNYSVGGPVTEIDRQIDPSPKLPHCEVRTG